MKRYIVKRCAEIVRSELCSLSGVQVAESYHTRLIQFDVVRDFLHDGNSTSIKGKPNQCYWIHKNELVEVEQ